MLVPGRPKRQRLRRGTVCGNRSVSLAAVRLGRSIGVPRSPSQPPARAPNFSSPDIVGSLSWREGTPAPRVAARPPVPRTEAAVQVPRTGRRPGWCWLPRVRVSRGSPHRLMPRPGGPSVPGLTAPVPTTPWPAGSAVGHREWPRPLRSPPGPTTRRGVAGSPLSGSTGRSRPHPHAQTSTASSRHPSPGDPGPGHPGLSWPRRLSASGSSWGGKYRSGNFSQGSPAVPGQVSSPLPCGLPAQVCVAGPGWTTQLQGFSCLGQFNLFLPQIRVFFL